MGVVGELIAHRLQVHSGGAFPLLIDKEIEIEREMEESPQRHIAQIRLGIQMENEPSGRQREVDQLALIRPAELAGAMDVIGTLQLAADNRSGLGLQADGG